MRIAIDLRQYTLSDTGGTTYAVGLIEHLPRYLDHDFVYVVNSNTENFARERIGDRHEIIVNDHQILRPRNPIAVAKRIVHDLSPLSRHIIDDLKVDIAHFPGDRISPRNVRTPGVLTFFGGNHFVLPNHVYWQNKTVQRIARQNVVQCLHLAKSILVPSVFVKSVLVNQVRIPAERVFVRELVSWASGIETEEACEKPGGIPECKQFLLFTSSHVTYKNHYRLLGAFAKLPESIRKSMPLLITGKMPEGLEGRIKELNLSQYVHHLGFVSRAELVWLYRNAKAYVHPSLYEAGGSFSMFEAAYSGTPVLCSQLNSMLEMMPNAIHFDPYDEEAIASKLLLAAENDLSDVALRGYQRMKSFHLEDSVAVTGRAYEKALADA
ncbi:glycosyltransferase [Mariniblastus fucicola]|uniref:Lipopolysaccharide core biosynthesis protein RfaG n=1 Tax=Mariniblastus fucicola TaxID=980251 RepID=A0A5B9PCQ3_9BACT|nr:glycosyltransferase [Mariniblastus fucicola]QEG22326.1 Lipopolysaccharide core biosynthesis protein RfaG [Mariniblastus fucicola]